MDDLLNLGAVRVCPHCKQPEAKVRVILPPDKDDLFYALDPESREELAAELNCDMFFPKDDELQVDIDTEEQFTIFRAAIKAFPRGFVRSTRSTISSSGGQHKHIYIKLSREFTVLERIGLQFMLGSDPMRESLSALRFLLDIPNPICLFEVRRDVKTETQSEKNTPFIGL